MAAISTSFQKLEFSSDSVENPRCSNCWQQGSIEEPLYDLHPSSQEHHLACRDCTTSWVKPKDRVIQQIFQCHICEKQINVDETVTRALGILPGDEESATEDYVIVAMGIDQLSTQALAPPPDSGIPPLSIASLLAAFGLADVSGEMEWVDLARDLSKEQGGAASSASVAVSDAEWKPARISFFPDCKDVRSGKEWRGRTEAILDAKPPETFRTLANPSPGHEEIANLLHNELRRDLWVKHADNRYKDASHRYAADLKSVACIKGAFYDALNEAIEEIIRTQRIEMGITFMNQQVFSILEKCFAYDEESTASFNSRYNKEVLALCKPIISEMLQKPCVSRVLEEFFLQHLKEELFRR